MRVEIAVLDEAGEVVEALLAGQNGPSELAIPAGIALIDMPLQRAVLQHRCGIDQRPGGRIHRADVGVQEVVGLARAARLR